MRIELKGSLRSSVVLGEMLGARHEGAVCELVGIATDSREVRTGDLFVALDGKRVSGASFLADALSAGAGALLVQQGIVVPDGTTAAL